MVKRAKYGDGRYPDELVTALVDLVRRWQPDPAPEWVTVVPSAAHPQLVPDLAARLADQLQLPRHDLVRRVRPAPPQKEMENSNQQVRNVLGAFELGGDVPAGPVLLVDDITDSRWTLTVVGMILRRAGSGPVHPLVLAKAEGT